MSRVFGVTLAVVGLFVADTRLLAEEKGATSGDIVCLNCREVEHANDDGFPLPLLARELVREAFLVAARDELGLLTRDATLREVFPTIADKRWAPFDCFSYVDPVKHGLDYHYYLGREGKERTKARRHVLGMELSRRYRTPARQLQDAPIDRLSGRTGRIFVARGI